ncbi:prenyltransferase/squalene oxidase repeat-containing protein [Amycolatopsis anabasis]|uniref:prenyltransferase/squalene oxidase repeat-containing protein n=1 Tax=Amycolatopsis anabasis TaxID=1840409 RepID=UPI00131A81A1|nr:prenyltransferase/squalene oxidase repeat-containing protein [Amycolatopsis anabasis]
MDTRESWTVQANRLAERLLSEMAGDPYGRFSSSVYETARLVTLAPSLSGQDERVRFLVGRQHQDGGWGGPGSYGLAPTLSATEALLSFLRESPVHGDRRPPLHAKAVRAADRGLRVLFSRLNGVGRSSLPDTVAVEIIVPGLVADINAHLDRLEREPLPGLDAWRGGRRLTPPVDTNAELLARLRNAVRAGHALPSKLLHSLEVIGPAARGAPFIEPAAGGVGCSPAATATWLGDAAIRANHPSVRYLEAVQGPGGGAVPVAAPLGLFERAWVLATLAGAGFRLVARDPLVRSVHAAFGETGTAGGPGLPPDADDTSTALYALALLGSPRSPESLWNYHAGAHFSCFPDERTPSTSANAHVLQALGACLTPDLPGSARYLDAVGRLTGWLCDRQETDGCWWDKWHASPYYATACCAVALADFGGPAARAAVRRAVEWVLLSQRTDGSWGRWDGTYEETAYAVRVLLQTPPCHRREAVTRAAARGAEFLLRSADAEHPPLWHDKDLYTPTRIVRAEGLAALHLARTDAEVAALIARWETEPAECEAS